MKYIIYCRKSSEEISKQAQSLETQETMLLEYAKKQQLSIVQIIKESKSAKMDGNRPLFNAMLESIRNGKASGILVLHTDRLSRNTIEAGQLIKLFDLGFLEEIITPTNVYKSTMDLFYIGFDFLRASQYSRDLSVKVKEGNATKRNKGEYIGSPPLGYMYLKGKIIPDPIRAKYITNAFELYSTGEYSLKQLTKILYLQGLRSCKTRNKVCKNSIYLLLSNPVYYGVIRNQGTLQVGIHEPLTTKVIFDKVQAVLKGKNRTKKQKHDFLYRGYLTCGNCGCKLTATVKKGKYDYYYCTNGKGNCDENKKYMNKPYVFKTILELFSDFTLNKEKADLAFDLYINKLKTEHNEKGIQRESILKQINDLDKQIDRLINLSIKGIIEDDKFISKQNALKNEKVELEVYLSQVKEQSLETTLELLSEFKNQACSLAEMFEFGDDEVRQDLLKSALWNLDIKDMKIASVQYKLPYEYMKNFNKTEDLQTMLGSLDSNQNKQIQSLLSYL